MTRFFQRIPEFLKSVIMQSHDCAKYLQICANFGLMNVKQEKLALIPFIFHNWTKFFYNHQFLYNFYRMFLRKIVKKSILIAQNNLLLESLEDSKWLENQEFKCFVSSTFYSNQRCHQRALQRLLCAMQPNNA